MQDSDLTLLDTFRSDIPDWDPDNSLVMEERYDQYSLFFDMKVSMLQIRGNLAWEAWVRKSGYPIPVIRGPIVLLGPPDIDWSDALTKIGEHFQRVTEAASALCQLSIEPSKAEDE